MAALVSKCKGAEDLEYFLLETASLVGLNTPPEAGAKVRQQAAGDIASMAHRHHLVLHPLEKPTHAVWVHPMVSKQIKHC
jgi:hypothetical protein